MSITSLSPLQLRRAADLKEQIEGLQNQLISIFAGENPLPAITEAPVVPQLASAPSNGRRPVSAQARARMAAAQKARWAAKRGEDGTASVSTTATEAPKVGRSAGWRKALSLAAKKRWAAKRGESETVTMNRETTEEPKKKKRTMTEAWRQALARAHAARRAKAKAARKTKV